MRCFWQARAAHVCMSFLVHIFRFEKAVEQKVQSVFQFEVVAPTNVNKPASVFQRYAVSSTEATCHRWREDHYSEPNRPAKVNVERAGLGGDRFISYHSWSIYTFQILILINLSSLCSLTCFQTELQRAMLLSKWSCCEQLSLLAIMKEQVLLASILAFFKFIICITEDLLFGISWTFLNSYSWCRWELRLT